MDEFQSIFNAYLAPLKSNISEYAEKKLRLRIPKVPYSQFEKLIKNAESIFSEEPNILMLSSESTIHVVGCLYGHLLDLLAILKMYGVPPQSRYLFLGNFINQGEFSLETLILIFTLKVMFPEHVFIIRGDQETKDVCVLQEFYNELISEYDDKLFFPIVKVFSQMPLAAIIDGKVLCVSGGIGINVQDINTINEIKRPAVLMNNAALIEILFSDPTEFLPMFMPASRGFGNLFGENATADFLKKIKFQTLIRGRQLEMGVKSYFNNACYSVCSASTKESLPGIITISNEQINTHELKKLDFLPRNDVVFLESLNDNTYVPDNDVLKYKSRRLSFGLLLVNDKKTLPKHPENSRKLTKRSSLVSISMPRFTEAAINVNAPRPVIRHVRDFKP